MRARRQQGLTLVELVMSMGLTMVMLLMAIPGYHAIIGSAQRSSVITELSASFLYSRAEAVKSGSEVFMCPGNPDEGCAHGLDVEWTRGWFVYRDKNGNHTYDGDSELLRVHAFSNPTFTLLGTSGARLNVGLEPTGSVRSPGSIDYCDHRGKSGITVKVRATGRLKIVKTGDCGQNNFG